MGYPDIIEGRHVTQRNGTTRAQQASVTVDGQSVLADEDHYWTCQDCGTVINHYDRHVEPVDETYCELCHKRYCLNCLCYTPRCEDPVCFACASKLS